MVVKQGWRIGLVLCGGLCLAGCSNSPAPDNSQAETSEASAGSSDESPAPVTASIGLSDDEDDEDAEEVQDVATAEPEAGSAEWHVREIVRLRLKPFPPQNAGDEADAAGEESSEDAAEETAAKELAHQAAIRRERNLEVIDLAKQAIALTHKNPEKEMVFNVAVHHMLDARLQLALSGEQDDVDALYQFAEVLQDTRPNSEAAAAAGLTIVNFAHANAVRYAQTEPKWIEEFARQAKVFANRLSDAQAELPEAERNSRDNRRAVQLQNDISRASQILLAAGQSCEAAGLANEAKACYLLLTSKFTDTPAAQQAAGIIRRLNLRGQPLQLAGPTLDGQHLSIEHLKGKTVLVVFWSSQAKPFVDQLPALTEFLKKAPKSVAVVGVNLDTDELELADFIEGRGLDWPQIFHSEPEKRGWNSPAASYYGIMNLPTFWVVDATGVVAETEVTAENVKSKLAQVYRQDQQARSGGKSPIRPASNTADKSSE